MESGNTCEKCRCVDGQCSPSDLLTVDPLNLLAVDPMDLLSGDPLNLEYIDVEIPLLNPKIIVNMEQELPSLENSIEESIHALNNPDIIFTKLQMAFETFKELTGRQMTYSEMREMMG